jgi:hypothetical protein
MILLKGLDMIRTVAEYVCSQIKGEFLELHCKARVGTKKWKSRSFEHSMI